MANVDRAETPNQRQAIRDVKLGENVRIFDFVNLYECEIGDNSRIGSFVEIQKRARIGQNVKISTHTFICEGVTIEDDVFIGHNVSFINDRYPRATVNGRLQTAEDWECVPTLVQRGASIGTSATILCGVTIGENAMVGAGSVVTDDVPANTVVAGAPARILRTLDPPSAAGPTTTAVPFVDLKTQYRAIRGEIRGAIDRILDSGSYVLGEEVAAFEREFAAYSAAEFGVALNSGTSALHLALLAADIGPGDEVITVPFTFVATVAAILYAGAKPVLVDIDPRTFTLDVAQLERAIGPRTRAIMPVHLYGQPADMEPIQAIARRHGLVVIEDAAQAHGAEYKGQRAGRLGDLGCFSFYPGKNLGAYGEGGLVTTNNAEYARKIRMLRDWGQERKYRHVLKGYNYRMEGFQGAILRVKLRRLEEWTEARRAHASRYDELLAGSGVTTPIAMADRRHVYHVYAVRTNRREALQHDLQAAGIQSGIHYPIPVHLQPAYADLGYREGDFPESERAAAEVLSLPMYPELTVELQQRVVEAVRRSNSAR
jgi:dTDP-4-amino-4,6-dideoxygalactose transaminase/acetyltransferase-like isoleucine patch superfamily enzyme